MQLTGDRIALALLDQSDLALFIELSMSPQMMEHISDTCTFAEANAAFTAKSQPWCITSDTWLSFSISAITTGEKIGNIGLKIVDHQAKIAEIGFMLKPEAQGQGFAGESLNLLKQFAFTALALDKLVATCAVANARSYNLLEKCGFVREQHLKQHSLINGTYVDDYVYGVYRHI